MKKRLIGSLLMGALLVSSVSTLTSCKDYDDDINGLKGEINALSSSVAEKEAAIKTLIANLETAYKQADTELEKAYKEADANLENAYKQADATLKKGYEDGDVATLAAAKTAIAEAKGALEKTINEKYNELKAKNDAQDIAIAKAQSDASSALSLIADLQAKKADKTEVEAVANDLKTAVTRIENLETKLSTLEPKVAKAVKDIEALETAVKAQDAAIKAVESLANTNKSDIAKLRSDLEAGLNKAASDLATAKSQLSTEIKNVETTLGNSIEATNTRIDNVRTELLNTTTVIDTKYNVITIMLSKALRSLVYMPTLYVDGIETIEYPYEVDTLLTRVNVNTWDRTENGEIKTIADVKDYRNPTTLVKGTDWFVYGPAWPVYYHQNPSVSSTKYSNIIGYYAYDVETMTRSTLLPGNENNVWGITSPEKYANGDMLFKNGAVLTAGLQIATPELIQNVKNNSSSSYYSYNSTTTHNPGQHSSKDVIVALQASSDVNGKDTVITSDYAMLYPEKIWIEGLVWKKGTETGDFPTYWYKDNTRIKNFWTSERGYSNYFEANPTTNFANRDEVGTYDAQKIHVWDTPEEALNNPADIELFLDDLDGVNIMQYIGVHFVHEAQTKAGVDRHPGTWAYNDDELKHFGLRWYLDVVDYSATNKTNPQNIIRTRDSRYVHFTGEQKDANNAQFINATTIIANDVQDIDGVNETFLDTKQVAATIAAAGREPLLRIRLYHMTKADMYSEYQDEALDINGNKYALDCGPKRPILDGYVRVRISKSELKEVAYPEFQKETFDLCNALTKETNWTLFDEKVLADGLGLEHDQFDALYSPELDRTGKLIQYSKPRNYSNLTAGDQGAQYYGFFNETAANRAIEIDGNKVVIKGDIGEITYRQNTQGTTNDGFVWTISPEELEAITHDVPVGTEFTIERYIHFTGHFEGNRGAKYDDVFVKLTRTIKRAEIPVAKLKNQNDDYYRFEKYVNPATGSAATYLSGFEAVAWNAPYPKDAESANTPAMMTVPFENNINNAFLNNNGVNAPAFDVPARTMNGWKYYFSPIEVEITALNGTTYVLTPKRGKDDNLFNKFICAYYKSDKHPFHITANGADKTDVAANRSTGALDNNIKANEVENNKIIAQCAIRYNTNTRSNPYVDGVFANDTLYAIAKTAYATQPEYEPIAILNTTTGAVTLLHESNNNKWLTANSQPLNGDNLQENIYTELALNAFGYDEDVYETGQNPIHKQLRAWIGIIAKYANCDIALQMSDVNKKNENTFATWMNGWERPINVFSGEREAIDAKNNGNYIYLVDILDMYDWRGYALDSSNKKTFTASQVANYRGGMFGAQTWLWAYYGIKKFDIDVTEANVQTTLHWGTEFKKLSEVSHNLEFYAGSGSSAKRKNAVVPVTFSLRTPVDYCYASKNEDLRRELGFYTADDATGFNSQKAKYGYIFYTNNGDNVQDFYLKVPIKVYYDWGWITATDLTIKVHGSIGNND
jgi:hypothetical protein